MDKNPYGSLVDCESVSHLVMHLASGRKVIPSRVASKGPSRLHATPSGRPGRAAAYSHATEIRSSAWHSACWKLFDCHANELCAKVKHTLFSFVIILTMSMHSRAHKCIYNCKPLLLNFSVIIFMVAGQQGRIIIIL